MCAQLRFNTHNEIGIKVDNEHWYKHVPILIEISHKGKVTVLWNQQVHTDRNIPNNHNP
jgi:hypothetical protein